MDDKIKDDLRWLTVVANSIAFNVAVLAGLAEDLPNYRVMTPAERRRWIEESIVELAEGLGELEE